MECVQCGKKMRGRPSPTGICPACRGAPRRLSQKIKISVQRETAESLAALAVAAKADVSSVIEQMIAGQVHCAQEAAK